MIHTIYTMTIGQYGVLDDTGDLRYLRKWYNLFPISMFRTEKYFEAHREAFGNDINISKDVYKIISYNRLLMLDRIYKTMLVLMESQNKRTIFDMLLGRKMVTIKSNLGFYKKKVEEITGIKVNDGHDLKLLHKEIIRRMDKYKELNPDKVVQEKTPFTESAHNVFGVSEQPYNKDMTIFEFSKLKKRADNIIKKQQSNGSK